MARELQQSFIGGEVSQRMFGRVEDPRLRHGAAKLQNMLVTPQGPAQKRPGLGFVREVKDSANRARLIPFSFSQDDTLVIEMGRDTVQSREIGYFRFHTNGGTVLYTAPPGHLASTTLSSEAASVFTASAAHGLSTGDKVLFTMHPTTDAVTFAISSPGVVTYTAHNFAAGQQVIFEAQGAATFPPEVVDKRLYYVHPDNINANDFQISETPNGNPVNFTVASTGTINAMGMPHSSTPAGIYARRVYYFIDVTSTTFSLAETREDALAGTAITINNDGGNVPDIRLHVAYQTGDVVGNAQVAYYCLRSPTGEETTPILTVNDDTGHNTTDADYWSQLPGAHLLAATFDDSTDRITFNSHGRSAGDPVVFTTDGSLPTGLSANTTYYLVNPTANDYQVAATLGGGAIDFTGTGSGSHTQAIGSIFEAPHWFTLAEILEVGHAQSNDVITITHVNRPAWELRRLGATSWVSEDARFNRAVTPGDILVTATAGSGIGVASVTAATPAVVTLDEVHGFVAGAFFTVYLQGIGSIVDNFYTADAVGTAAFEVKSLATRADVTSSTTSLDADALVQIATAHADDFVNVYVVTSIASAGDESIPSDEFSVTNNLLAEGAFNTVTWTQVSGAERYRVYKKQNGVFGFIGEVLSSQPLSFKDDNIAPDLSITAPIIDSALRQVKTITFDATNDRVEWAGHGLPLGTPVVFRSSGDLPTALTDYTTYFIVDPTSDSFQVAATSGGAALALSGGDASTGEAAEHHEAIAGEFPATVTYFEQRRVFAGSLTQRQRVRMTASGTDADLSFSIPTVDSDRIKFDVASLEAGAARHVVPLSHLMVLSASTEFRVTPINSDAITPTSISVRPQSFVGASTAQPVVVNNNGIFAANRGGHIRQMGFSENVLSYLSGDLSLRATHLFDGLTIEQLAYAKAPIPTVWAVSSNGKLLALTYIPEEQVLAWHQHTTTGTFESVAAVAEGMEDHVYVIVNRTINSATVRYVERMSSHDFATLSDAFFVDAGFTYDGAATTTIAGLDHLEGEAVSVLADGLVVTGLTVSSGAITLTTAASTVHVGIPYTAEVETLPVSAQRQAAGRGMEKNVSKVWLRVEESGAFTVGPTTSQLVASQSPAAGALLSDSVKINVPGDWNHHGQIFLQQSTPLPLTVVSVVYEFAEGGF